MMAGRWPETRMIELLRLAPLYLKRAGVVRNRPRFGKPRPGNRIEGQEFGVSARGARLASNLRSEAHLRWRATS
jgi:hypothetical protein